MVFTRSKALFLFVYCFVLLLTLLLLLLLSFTNRCGRRSYHIQKRSARIAATQPRRLVVQLVSEGEGEIHDWNWNEILNHTKTIQERIPRGYGSDEESVCLNGL